MKFKMMCYECGDSVGHSCGDQTRAALEDAVHDLLTWVPDHISKEMKTAIQKNGEANRFLNKGESFAETPLFGAQPWMYSILGKDNARSFHYLISSVIRSAGLDPEEARTRALTDFDRRNNEKIQNQNGRDDRLRNRKEAISLFTSKTATLEEKIAKLDEILWEKAQILSPTEPDDSGRGGWDHLARWVNELYEGGINPSVNRLRIEECRRKVVEEGPYILQLRGYSGTVVSLRFASEALAIHHLKNPGEDSHNSNRTVFAVVRTNAAVLRVFVKDENGQWIPGPKVDS